LRDFIRAEALGLSGSTPEVLSSGSNLVVHLAPYPVVARLAMVTFATEIESLYQRVNCELRVARHLFANDVPVLLPTDYVDAGPHPVDGTWMTLWTYIPSTRLEPLSSDEAVERAYALSAAMGSYPGELPALGVWERTCRSAGRLRDNPDPLIQSLLMKFCAVDGRMRREIGSLVPCHGDSHSGNLMPSPEGWLWTDFEDASMMPLYWDLTSFVANRALFNGFQEPTLRCVLNRSDIMANTRVLMSTLGNTDYALAGYGYGDLEFAVSQVRLVGDFITHVEHRSLSM
jgi:hypothetical protein